MMDLEVLSYIGIIAAPVILLLCVFVMNYKERKRRLAEELERLERHLQKKYPPRQMRAPHGGYRDELRKRRVDSVTDYLDSRNSNDPVSNNDDRPRDYRTLPPFNPGGGSFGGAGAQAIWEDPASAAAVKEESSGVQKLAEAAGINDIKIDTASSIGGNAAPSGGDNVGGSSDGSAGSGSTGGD
jgi:hypothetical protein